MVARAVIRWCYVSAFDGGICQHMIMPRVAIWWCHVSTYYSARVAIWWCQLLAYDGVTSSLSKKPNQCHNSSHITCHVTCHISIIVTMAKSSCGTFDEFYLQICLCVGKDLSYKHLPIHFFTFYMCKRRPLLTYK